MRSSPSYSQQIKLFGVLLLLGTVVSVLAYDPLFMLIPAAAIITYAAVMDIRLIFYLLIASLPFTIEMFFSNGLGTDLPAEPISIFLSFVMFAYILSNPKYLKSKFVNNPIALLVLLHLLVILITSVTATDKVNAFKYFLAKTWYIFAFFFAAGLVLKKQKDYTRFVWLISIPAILSVLFVLVNHAAYGFEFREVHRIMHPFYRNHVNYAAFLAALVPFVYFTQKQYRLISVKSALLFGILGILLLGIFYSYTRAAYISLGIALGAYFIIKLKAVRLVLISAMTAAIIGVGYMAWDNKYLDFAPKYDQTISHFEFDDLVEATVYMKDISTMERVYRWVAGFQMSFKRPVTGYGPANFFEFYKSHTVSSFETYVSRNKDNSSIHNYFLLVLVEQGFPGLIVFLLLTFIALLHGERTYHKLKTPWAKNFTMACLLSLIIINSFLLINDLLEAIKIGSLFFINLAVLVNMEIFASKEGT